MEIKYYIFNILRILKINRWVTRSEGVKDHNASRREVSLRSVITIADDNMQDQHCSCIAGYVKLMYI